MVTILQTSSAALKDAHMGKRLLYKMMKCSEYVGFLNHYHYIYTWTSNIKSAKTVEKLNYQKISEVNGKVFEHSGIRYFEHIDESSKWQELWIKRIEGGTI